MPQPSPFMFLHIAFPFISTLLHIIEREKKKRNPKKLQKEKQEQQVRINKRESRNFGRSPVGRIMKEEEPMLQNHNSSTPTTHKIHFLKSDDPPLTDEDDTTTTTARCIPHNTRSEGSRCTHPYPEQVRRMIPLTGEDDDKEKSQPEILDGHKLKKEENTSECEDTKEEELSMSSSFSNGGLKEESGRERLKRHRVEVAGKVWIPDTWGQEDLLKDWIDCSTFDSDLVPKGIMSARAALVEEGRRAHSGRIGVENSC